MSNPAHDKILVQLLIKRLVNQGLPRVLQMKEKVLRSQPLNEFDISYLHQMLKETTRLKVLVDHNPQYHALVLRMSNLYKEITEKALENENE